MAKIKNKELIGMKVIARIEVEQSDNEFSNSYVSDNNIINHNCNGPHVPLVCVDEIDTVSGEGLRAFKDITGMLDSKRGRKALRVGISTRKSRYGLMNQQIENAEAEGRTVRKWTALEFSQRCPDERSGIDETVGYVLQDEMQVITEEQFEKKDKTKQKEYFKNLFPGSGCLSCPMAAVCLGDAKTQKSLASMLKPIGDSIKKTRENGADWALSQLFNLKPSVEGIVFKEFDEKQHVKDWNGMWETLVGSPYPGECTHDIFIKKCHQMKLPFYAGIDWGWSSPSTVVYICVDNRETVYVVRCEGRTYMNNPSWVQTMKNKWHNMYRCQLYYPDLANPGDALTMRSEGLPCANEVEKNIDSGVQVIKKWLRSLASPVPKIYFAKEFCQPIFQEFSMFHYKTDAAGNITDEYASGSDHFLDSLRYTMYGLFGKGQMVMAHMDNDFGSNLTDGFGNFSRQPSPMEYAKSKGIALRDENPEERAKLGQISNTRLIEEDDESGPNSGSSGSFLWSF